MLGVTLNSIYLPLAILAAAITVARGIGQAVRMMWRLTESIREMHEMLQELSDAVRENTRAIDELAVRYIDHESRLEHLERIMGRGHARRRA